MNKIVATWIDDDLSENAELYNIREATLAQVESPNRNKILLTAYEPGGKTKFFKEKKKEKKPVIPTKMFQEFLQLREENEALSKQIPLIQAKINQVITKNQQAKTLILDTNKSIRQIENETNEKKKTHLKKIAEIEMIKKKNEIEKARSEKAQKDIVTSNINLKAELERIRQEEEEVDARYKQIREEKKVEEAKLAKKTKIASELLEVYQKKIAEIEKELARRRSRK